MLAKIRVCGFVRELFLAVRNYIRLRLPQTIPKQSAATAEKTCASSDYLFRKKTEIRMFSRLEISGEKENRREHCLGFVSRFFFPIQKIWGKLFGTV